MISSNDSEVPLCGTLEAAADSFRWNRFCVLPSLLDPKYVAELNAAIDRDHTARPYLWDIESSCNGSSNLLLTEPVFEKAVGHPDVTSLV